MKLKEAKPIPFYTPFIDFYHSIHSKSGNYLRQINVNV